MTGELVWPQLLADFERGELKRIYALFALPDLKCWRLISERTSGEIGIVLISAS